MEKQNVLFKIEGFLGKNAPDNKLFVNGITLNMADAELLGESSNGFAWGYVGQGSRAAAAAVLSKFLPLKGMRKKEKDFIRSYVIIHFTQTQVQGWGYGNFMVEIDMEHWLRTHGNYYGPIKFHHITHLESKRINGKE
jgi:hypothetical protein